MPSIPIRKYGPDYIIGKFRLTDIGEGQDGECWVNPVNPDTPTSSSGPFTFKQAIEFIFAQIQEK
jgi:hypothetical protein